MRECKGLNHPHRFAVSYVCISIGGNSGKNQREREREREMRWNRECEKRIGTVVTREREREMRGSLPQEESEKKDR